MQHITGNPDTSKKVVELITSRAMEQKRCEQLIKENNLLKRQLDYETKKRRNLHNALEDLKGSIRVIVRIRPLLEHEKSTHRANVILVKDSSTVIVNTAVGLKTYEFFW